MISSTIETLITLHSKVSFNKSDLSQTRKILNKIATLNVIIIILIPIIIIQKLNTYLLGISFSNVRADHLEWSVRVRHCQQPLQDRGRGGGRASRVPLECLHPLPEGGRLVQVWRGPAGPGGYVGHLRML